MRGPRLVVLMPWLAKPTTPASPGADSLIMFSTPGCQRSRTLSRPEGVEGPFTPGEAPALVRTLLVPRSLPTGGRGRLLEDLGLRT